LKVLRKVRKVVKCPYCGFEGEFKLLKTWRYRWWNVYLYECPKCSGRFRYQVDPTGKRKDYVMRLRGYLSMEKDQEILKTLMKRE
jgi:DNA-directed RNA polymerase subunit RPC12/RpoP